MEEINRYKIMDRKKFLKKGLVGLGTITSLPVVMSSCSSENDTTIKEKTPDATQNSGSCELSPKETAGPFPIKTPTELVRENIIGDRSGVALLITITVQEKSNGCKPIAGAYVDLWHCDAKGAYSQYGGTRMQPTDYTNNNFLRGRQKTNAEGKASFISIFPGWYRGRAPHIHLEILDSSKKSLRVSQIAFPKDVCDTVYATSDYNGEADTQNDRDNVFSDSLTGNMLDSLKGNTKDGYTLLKTIVV